MVSVSKAGIMVEGPGRALLRPGARHSEGLACQPGQSPVTGKGLGAGSGAREPMREMDSTLRRGFLVGAGRSRGVGAVLLCWVCKARPRPLQAGWGESRSVGSAWALQGCQLNGAAPGQVSQPVGSAWLVPSAPGSGQETVALGCFSGGMAVLLGWRPCLSPTRPCGAPASPGAHHLVAWGRCGAGRQRWRPFLL